MPQAPGKRLSITQIPTWETATVTQEQFLAILRHFASKSKKTGKTSRVILIGAITDRYSKVIKTQKVDSTVKVATRDTNTEILKLLDLLGPVSTTLDHVSTLTKAYFREMLEAEGLSEKHISVPDFLYFTACLAILHHQSLQRASILDILKYDNEITTSDILLEDNIDDPTDAMTSSIPVAAPKFVDDNGTTIPPSQMPPRFELPVWPEGEFAEAKVTERKRTPGEEDKILAISSAPIVVSSQTPDPELTALARVAARPVQRRLSFVPVRISKPHSKLIIGALSAVLVAGITTRACPKKTPVAYTAHPRIQTHLTTVPLPIPQPRQPNTAQALPEISPQPQQLNRITSSGRFVSPAQPTRALFEIGIRAALTTHRDAVARCLSNPSNVQYLISGLTRTVADQLISRGWHVGNPNLNTGITLRWIDGDCTAFHVAKWQQTGSSQITLQETEVALSESADEMATKRAALHPIRNSE